MVIRRGYISRLNSVSVYTNNMGFVFIHAQNRLYLAEFMLTSEVVEITVEYDDMLDADIILLGNERLWTSQDDRFLASEMDFMYFKHMIANKLLDFSKELSLVENINRVNNEIAILCDEAEPYTCFGGSKGTFRYISFLNSDYMFDMQTARFIKESDASAGEVYIGDLKALHGFSELCKDEWFYKSSSQKDLDGVEYYLNYYNGSVYLITMMSSDSVLITRSGNMISTNQVRHLNCKNIGYEEIQSCSQGTYRSEYTSMVEDVTLLEYQFMCYLVRCSTSLEDCLNKARDIIKSSY